jgi:hypothetical protein
MIGRVSSSVARAPAHRWELEVKPNSGLRLRESDEGPLGEASANDRAS